jgi:hypothetical protein
MQKWITEKAKEDKAWEVFISNGPTLLIAHKNASKTGDTTSTVSASKIVDVTEFKTLLVQLYFTSVLYRHFENVEDRDQSIADKGNRRINFEQFKLAVKAVTRTNAREELSDEQLIQDFNDIDKKSLGSISFMEVSKLSKSF